MVDRRETEGGRQAGTRTQADKEKQEGTEIRHTLNTQTDRRREQR